MKKALIEFLAITLVGGGFATMLCAAWIAEESVDCKKWEGWTSESTYGAPEGVVPEWCYEEGYLERK